MLCYEGTDRDGALGLRGRRRPASALALGLALALGAAAASATPGCGLITGAAVLTGLEIADSGGSSDAAPPQLELASSVQRADLVNAEGAPSATEIAIAFRLIDPTGDAIDVDARFRLAADPPEALRPLTLAPGAPALTGLAASAAPGALHTLVWAAGVDLAASGVDEAVVELVLTPARGNALGNPRVVTLRAGNTPPSVALDPLDATLTRVVIHRATLEDAEGDAVRLTLTVRDVGAGSDAQLVPNILTDGGETRLPAADGPQRASFAWDTLAAFGVRDLDLVEVTLLATDRFGAVGSATASAPIANDAPPSARISAAGTATGIASVEGRVPIRFALFDPDAELDPDGPNGLPAVRIEHSVDGGQTFQPSTGLALRGAHGAELSVPSLDALRARVFPIGADGEGDNVHTFLWDARADGVGGGGQVNAIVRVTPVADGRDGQPDVSPVRLGQALRTFEEVQRIALDPTPNPNAPVDRLPRAIHIADVDGDGHLDLLVEVGPRGQISPTSTVRVALGSGDGTFGAAHDIPANGTIAIGDLDGDGIPDLFETGARGELPAHTFGMLRVWIGQGDGQFEPLLVGEPPSAFISPTIGFPARPVLADLDGDGLLDIVFGHVFVEGVDVRFGTTTPPYFEVLPGGSPLPLQGAVSGTRVRLGDVTGDGHLDIIASDGGTQLAVHVGLGGRAFAPEFALTLPRPAQRIEVADVDGDGFDDVVAFREGELAFVSETIDVLLASGDPALPLQADPIAIRELGARSAALVDLDGDRRPDLLLGTTVPSELRVRLGDGRGGFAPAFGAGFGLAVSQIALGDINGDGVLDVVAGAEQDGGVLSVRLGRQSGLSAEPTISPGGAAALADIDGDGHLDLVTARFATIARKGDGLAGFSLAGSRVTAPAEARGVLVADVMGDGLLDIVVSARQPDASTSTLTLYLGSERGPLLLGPPEAPLELDVAPGPLTAVGPTRAGLPEVSGFLSSAGLLFGEESGALGVLRPSGSFALDGQSALTPQTFPASAVHADGDVHVVVGASSGFFSGLGSLVLAASAALDPPGLEPRAFERMGTAPLRSTLADLDGDGHLDLVAADLGGFSLTDGNLVVRRGLGEGAFGPAVLIATGPAIDLGVADLDGDGALDIAVWQPVRNIVTLFRQPPFRGLEAPGARVRGDGRSFGLAFARTEASVPDFGNVEFGLLAADVSGDDVADLVLPGDPVQLLIPSVTAVSRRDEALGAAAGVEVRAVPVAPLAVEVAELESPLPDGAHLRPASGAVGLTPEGRVLEAGGTLTIALRSWLTAAELTSGRLRVLAELRGLASSPAAGVDRITGAARTRHIVEVGRIDLGDPTESFPAGIAIDLEAGTLTLPIDQLARYQVFLEAPRTTALLLREGFDAPLRVAGAAPSEPRGWAGSAAWQTGAPGPDRPAPASAPGLLAVGLKGGYRASVDTAIRSPAVRVGATPLGRRARLRLLQWHDLGPGGPDGDAIELALRFVDDGGAITRTVIETFTGVSAGPQPALQAQAFDVTQAIADALLAAESGQGASALDVAVELRLIAGDGPGGRGCFVDDLELTIEAE